MLKRCVVGLLASCLMTPVWYVVTPATATNLSASPEHSARSVCAGLGGCRVVARTDVNGDGRRDVVGLARRGRQGSSEGAVIVRVKVGPRRIETVRRQIYWYGPVWQGVANLDNRAGKEILVGDDQGAHTQFFTALTWHRPDGLVRLNAPGGDRSWVVDSAIWISYGWLRRPSDPAGVVVRRVALREADGSAPFTGKVTTFRRSGGSWQRVSSRTVAPLPEKRAYSWGGFHVPGLPRW